MTAIVLLALGALGIFAATAMASSAASTSVRAAEKQAATKRVVTANEKAAYWARRFLKYVNGGGTSSAQIKTYQGRIGAKKTGIADGQSEARIEKILGYDVTWKPKQKIAQTVYKATPVKAVKPATKTTTVRKASPVKVTPEKDPLTAILEALAGKKTSPAKPAVKPAPKPAVKKTVPKALPATTTAKPKLPVVPRVPDNVLAADSLDKYLVSGGLDRTKVKGYQARMGSIAADGVAGPKTLARAQSLLGRDLFWPAIEASKSLRKYWAGGSRNRDVIRGYQEKMGELVVDGLVGPKTKARYQSLTGKRW